MEITSVRVGNFRAVGNTVTLDLGDMTALIGSKLWGADGSIGVRPACAPGPPLVPKSAP